MNEQSLNTFTDIVDNSISNLNADIQNKLDIKLSTLKDGLKQEFCESLNFLKTDILERLLADNKKLRKRLSWIEEEIENLYAHIYDLEVAVQGNNQQHWRNNVEITGIPLTVNDENLEKTAIHMLNKIVAEPISPNEVETCHRIGGRPGEKGTIIRFTNRKRSDDIKGNRIYLDEVNLYQELGFPENSKLFINDNLNPYFKQIYYMCRVLKRKRLIREIEVFNGKIKILTVNQRWIKVEHHTVLMNICSLTQILLHYNLNNL